MSKLDDIYKKLLAAKEELEKGRKKLSDEYDPNDMGDDVQSEEDELDDSFHEFDPDKETEGDDADQYLKENDPDYNQEGKYDEYSEDEDEEAHQRGVAEDFGDEDTSPEMDLPQAQAKASSAAPAAAKQTQVEQQADEAEEVTPKRSGRFRQPTREELMSFRSYTRPWEQRAREATALKADPSKNPELARHGNIIEARNQYHSERNSAYRTLTSSDDYKNADPIAQMEMDDNFEKEWHSKNPDHLKTALSAHANAHQKGKSAKDLHAANKDAQIRNILTGGGHGGEGYSLEEGMQHAGGVKGEEGTQASVKQDPATSFAMGNQDFIRQYAEQYDKKAKKVGNIDEMQNYDEGTARDLNRILGEGPQKDPKFEQFFSHYYPLIGMNAHKTLSRLGIDPKHPDVDMSMLHEAGMHGLIQAMNDYDHDNPGKASFSTHAANKIRGLQMTAMKNQDAIPTEIRQAQKKFASGRGVAAPKPNSLDVIKRSQHPNAGDMADRLKRVGAQRQAQQAQKVIVRKKETDGSSSSGGNNGGQPGGGL